MPIFLICLALSIVFVYFATFDFFVMKSGDLARVVQMREVENVSGPRNSLSGLIVALLSASPALLAVCLISGFGLRQSWSWAGLVVAVAGGACLFLSGGRNPFFLSLGYAAAYWCFFRRRQPRRQISIASVGVRIIASALVVVAMIYSFRLFIDRFALRGMTPLDILAHYERDYPVQFVYPQSDDPTFVAVYVSLLLFIFYLTHAPSYLDAYFVGPVRELFLGAYNFPIPFRTVDVAVGTRFVEDVARETIGAYLTLPGSLYLDFGYAGALLAAAILGFSFGWLLSRKDGLAFHRRLLLCFLALVMVFAPFYSAMALGNGFSFMVLIGGAYFVKSARSRV